MSACFLLSLTLTQIIAGQELDEQPRVIQTAPIVVPCLECLKNSGNLAPSCSCALNNDHSVSRSVVDQNTQIGPIQETHCTCGCVENQSDGGTTDGPSFSAAMLGPLASILTSIMSGMGSNNGDQPVNIEFSDEACNYSPSNESPCNSSPSNEVLFNSSPRNHSRNNIPPSTVKNPEESTPLTSNTQLLPKQIQITENRLSFGSCQRPTKASKGISEIEEDSLYAFKSNKPEEKGLQHLNINPDIPPSETLSSYSCSMGSHLQHQPASENINMAHQLPARDNNLIQPSHSGNSQFDMISRLSSAFSSPPNSFNIQTAGNEQDFMPSQCCC